MTVAIQILARAPVAGAAKTRLIPALGARGAARLQGELVHDTVARAVASAAGPVTLYGTGDDPADFIAGVAQDYGIPWATQPSGDLGQRMRQVLADGLARNTPALVIGTDCPALTAAAIALAARRLREHDAVLAPAHDGGYVLLGVHQAHAALFSEMEWGSDCVLADTRSRLRMLGWSWCELEPRDDVDRPADLARLAELTPAWAARLAELGGSGKGEP